MSEDKDVAPGFGEEDVDERGGVVEVPSATASPKIRARASKYAFSRSSAVSCGLLPWFLPKEEAFSAGLRFINSTFLDEDEELSAVESEDAGATVGEFAVAADSAKDAFSRLLVETEGPVGD